MSDFLITVQSLTFLLSPK